MLEPLVSSILWPYENDGHRYRGRDRLWNDLYKGSDSGDGLAPKLAVPFTNSLENPYLLPGNIIESPDCYEPSVTADLSLGSLKLPLLTGGDNESAIASAACFIALVIRHSRAWFLEEKAQEFPQAEFDWSFHMGIPASSYDDTSLVSNFDQILKAAVLLSKEPQWRDQERTIKKEWLERATQRAKEEEFYDQVCVYPEIAAQLHGYIRSDRWDSTRENFCLSTWVAERLIRPW